MEYIGANLILSYSSAEKNAIITHDKRSTTAIINQDEFIPFLYLGGKTAAEIDHQALYEAFSITHLLNVSETPNNTSCCNIKSNSDDENENNLIIDDENNERKFNENETNSPIQSLHLPFLDAPNGKLEHILPQAFEFIEKCFEQKGCLLVHCRAGVSRSASVVAAFIMYRFGFNLKRVLTLMKERRPSVDPNFGFIYKLKELEKQYCDEDLEDSINVEEVWSKYWYDYEMVKEWTQSEIAELFSMDGDFDENVETLISLGNRSK